MSNQSALSEPIRKAEGLPYSEWKRPPDEKAVYLALVDVFKGITTKKAWKKKRIKTRILRKLDNRMNGPIRILVGQHGLDSVSESARILAADGIFQSTEKAKSRFPELFDQQPALDPVEEDPLSGAIPAETSGVHDASSIDESTIVYGALTKVPPTKQGIRLATKLTPVPTVLDAHSALPGNFPFAMQYRLMVQLQKYLERMCFVFGRQTMPDILDQNGWECAELVDVNQWIQLFRAQKCFRDARVGISAKAVEDMFQSVAGVRRTTVDRTRLDLKGIKQIFVNAEAFAKLLGDTIHLGTIAHIRSKIEDKDEKLTAKMQTLESEFEAALSKIEKERAVLDNLERLAISKAKRQSDKHQDMAAAELKRVLVSVDSPIATPNGTDDESAVELSAADTDSN